MTMKMVVRRRAKGRQEDLPARRKGAKTVVEECIPLLLLLLLRQRRR
jgi:hypothetical protein